MKNNQSKEITNFILENVEGHPSDIVAITANQFKVTRTTIHRHLSKLIKNKKLFKSGTTRNICYYLDSSINRKFSYKIKSGLNEDEIFSENIHNLLIQFPENIYDICYYGFTEIFNNAIEHSKGSTIKAEINNQNGIIVISITDNGIGIFKNISEYFHLEDIKESILALNKGKMTTDPQKHTGEGIFFTSKAFDQFDIFSNGIHFIQNNVENDWSIETITTRQHGTMIILSIDIQSPRTLVDLFKKFQNEETFAFEKTQIIVALSKFNQEKLFSRSQAKRITFGLEKFLHIILDFTDIKLVGQGFVDEIFRVFANAHKDITIDYINANEDVIFMIKRSLNTRSK